MIGEKLTPEVIASRARWLSRRFVACASKDPVVSGVLAEPTGSFIGLINLPEGKSVNALLARNSDGEIVAIDAATTDGSEKIVIHTGREPLIAYWNSTHGRRENSPDVVSSIRGFLSTPKKDRKTP